MNVKQLGWISCGPVMYAITPFGSYEIRPVVGKRHAQFELLAPIEWNKIIATATNYEALKATAQRDYHARINQAIEKVPE